jgi:hypothetical protein
MNLLMKEVFAIWEVNKLPTAICRTVVIVPTEIGGGLLELGR